MFMLFENQLYITSTRSKFYFNIIDYYGLIGIAVNKFINYIFINKHEFILLLLIFLLTSNKFVKIVLRISIIEDQKNKF